MPIWTLVAIFVLQSVNLVLAFFVLRRNPRSPLNQSLTAFIFTAVLWGFGVALTVQTGSEFVAATPFFFGAIALFTLFWFATAIPIKVKWHIPVVLVAILAVAFGLLSFIPGAYFNGVEVVNGGLKTELGFLYPGFLVYALATFVTSAGYFIVKYRKSTGILRAQFKYLLIGLGVFVGVVVITNVVLPAVGVTTFNGLAPSFFIIFTGFASYAILRYRLMDISSLLSRSLVYVLLVSTMTGLFASAGFFVTSLFDNQFSMPSVLVYGGLSLLIVLVYDPIKQLLTKGSSAMFRTRDYEDVVTELGKIAQQELEMEKLIGHVNTSLQERMRVSGSFILLPKGKDIFEAHSHETVHSGEETNLLLKHLAREARSKKSLIVKAELVRDLSDEANPRKRKKITSQIADFDAVGAEVLVPVFNKRKISMVIALQNKVGGGLFSAQELNVLEVISPQIGAAMDKARLYQETLGFTESLKLEVDKATKKLKDNNIYLKELDKSRAEFLSIASHQLRTPLTGITGYLSMLTEGEYGKLKKDQERVVSDVLTASKRLTRMVNVFLNVSRIEAGRFILNPSEESFTKLVREVYRDLIFNAEKRGLDLQLNLPKKEIPAFKMDADKAKDVIGNLVDNAIKYTDEGSITVNLEDKGTYVLFSVVDTGTGIPPKEAEGLFEKFVRGSGVAKVGKDGSGLGLFIAKKVVDAHGGKIWVQSEGLGKGSTFFVKWPKQLRISKKHTKERIIIET